MGGGLDYTEDAEVNNNKYYALPMPHYIVQFHCVSSLQLKGNIQSMISDYNDMCMEREELLYSLADVSTGFMWQHSIAHMWGCCKD